MNGRIIGVYSDGGCIERNPSTIGATWAYLLLKESDNSPTPHYVMQSGVLTPEYIGLDVATNNVAELYALVEAVMALPLGFVGGVHSDSMISLGRLFRIYIDRNSGQFERCKGFVKMEGIPGWLCTRTLNAQKHIGALRTYNERCKAMSPDEMGAYGGHWAGVRPVLLQGHPTAADLERGIGAKRGYPVSRFNVLCDVECTRVGKAFVEEQRQEAENANAESSARSKGEGTPV